jgi:hypothetical protein
VTAMAVGDDLTALGIVALLGAQLPGYRVLAPATDPASRVEEPRR